MTDPAHPARPAHPAHPAIELRDVHKRYPSRRGHDHVDALAGVDLRIETGTFAAILGPSGCGKTTLLRAVAGFERPDRGEISVSGRTVDSAGHHEPSERRRVGIVPQEGALFPHLSAAGNVAFGLPRGERRSRRVDDLLELVGLGGMGSRRPHELSGGQQQRVALARCLAPGPDVVLLDEPFAALDATLRADVREQTRRVLAEAGTTTLLVTHDQEEALSTASVVALMRDGVVVQCSSPTALYDDPQTLWAAGFVGEANVLSGTVSAGVADCVLGRIEVRADHRTNPTTGGPAALMLRPEHVQIADSGAEAVVERVTFRGHEHLTRVRLAEGTVLSLRSSGGPTCAPGTPVRVRVGGGAIGYDEQGRLQG